MRWPAACTTTSAETSVTTGAATGSAQASAGQSTGAPQAQPHGAASIGATDSGGGPSGSSCRRRGAKVE